MLLAHCGMGVFVIGVTLVGGYEREQDVVMQRADTVEMAGYTFRLDGVVSHRGPNYVADRATITVARAGDTVAVLTPERRIYTATRSPTDRKSTRLNSSH